MRRYSVRKLMSVAVVLMIAVLTLAFFSKVNLPETSMKVNHERIEKAFATSRLICFGRFVIEVPENVVIVHGGAAVDGDLYFYQGKAEKISEILASRLAEVEKEKRYIPDYARTDFPLMGKVVDGVVSGQKTVFGRADSVSYRIHSYIPVGNDLFVYESISFPEVDETPFINKVASKLRYRSNLEIPVGPGICVDSGFIPLEPKFENISIGLRFLDFPDVHLSIDARKNQDYLMAGCNLKELRESARSRAEATGFGGYFSKIKVLREGQREFGMWQGEEILTRRPAYKEQKDAHEFRFLSLGAVNDAYRPMIDIQLDSGVKGNAKAGVKPSITDEEALALWDKILSSIRVRQPSDATTPISPSPNMPIGSIGKSGDICPQSGWWKCMEPGSMETDGRRMLKEGEKMPLALIARKGHIWRWIIGDTHHIAAVSWKLVEYKNVISKSSVARSSDGIGHDADNEGAGYA